MSLITKTVEGEVLVQFTGYPISGVAVGDYEMPLDHFCIMVAHFLGGGFYGWGGETPESVNEALSYLFGLYEKKDGRWVRKDPIASGG